MPSPLMQQEVHLKKKKNKTKANNKQSAPTELVKGC